MDRFDSLPIRRSLSALMVLAGLNSLSANEVSADVTASPDLSLSKAVVMAGLESYFQQTSSTRTPDGRTHQHLRTTDPACVVFLDLNSGITGDLQSAHLLARVSDDPAAGGKIPDCSLEIANRFFSNVAARTPEGVELARHAISDALTNVRQAYAIAVGSKTASVRFDPDLHGLFAIIGADAN